VTKFIDLFKAKLKEVNTQLIDFSRFLSVKEKGRYREEACRYCADVANRERRITV